MPEQEEIKAMPLWYSLNADAVLARLEVDESGLSESEVQHRLSTMDAIG